MELLPKGITRHGEKYRWSICCNRQRKSGVCATLEDAVAEREATYKALITPVVQQNRPPHLYQQPLH